jgi:hypothetical protein
LKIFKKKNDNLPKLKKKTYVGGLSIFDLDGDGDGAALGVALLNPESGGWVLGPAFAAEVGHLGHEVRKREIGRRPKGRGEGTKGERKGGEKRKRDEEGRGEAYGHFLLVALALHEEVGSNASSRLDDPLFDGEAHGGGNEVHVVALDEVEVTCEELIYWLV